MAGKKGGKQPGAGRPKGMPNKADATIKELIDRVMLARKQGDKDGYIRVLDAIIEKALGVTVQEERDGEERIFTLPPDVNAAKLLLEMRFGKARESMDLNANVNVTDLIRRTVIVVPEKRKV